MADFDQFPDFDPLELAAEAAEAERQDAAFLSEVYRPLLSWPLGKRGREVTVVVGEEDAQQVASILRADPADESNEEAVVLAIPDLETVPPGYVALEIRTAALPDPTVWFVPSGSAEAARYADELSVALVGAGLPAVSYAPLPPGWKVADIADVAEDRSLLAAVLGVLGSGPDDELDRHLETLIESW